MHGIPLTRGQFLMPFIDILDEIGAPTVSLLAKFRLPKSLEGKADHYVPLLPAIRFAEAAQRSQDISDFGFLASQRLQFCHLGESLRNAVGYSPTLLVALQQTCRLAATEDTLLRMRLEHHGDHVRLCSFLEGTAGIRYLEHSQWLQNMFSIHIVRQFLGFHWLPDTIAFQAHYTPGPMLRSAWPNTRFLPGQKSSWIDIPVSCLSSPNLSEERGPAGSCAETFGGTGIVGTLKMLLPTYVNERAMNVADVAALANVSVRSLQRELARAGLTYSDMVDAARFEIASRLLSESDAKIIEVAFSAGYSDPAHFTRAFRRLSGVTPRQFRAERRPN